MKRFIFIGILVLLGYAFWYATQQHARTDETENHLVCAECNVIFVSVDTLRSDHVGAYGYERDTTPHLDEFAEKSVVFKRNYSNSATSAPSHMSIFTSLYPDVHRVLNRDGVLPESRDEITKLLKEEGYTTAWFHAHDPELSADRGYRSFDELYGTSFPAPDHPIFPWLTEHADDRFFAFVHSNQAHDPYLPPEQFANVFNPDYEGDAWRSDEDFRERNPELDKYYFNTYQDFLDAWGDDPSVMLDIYKEFREAYLAPFDLETKEDLEHLIALYDEEIRYTDLFLGELFKTIEELGLLENTIIVVYSDHGEAFLEHDNLSHQNLYEENVRTVNIIYIPGVEGTHVDSLVQSIDITPTVLDYLGIPRPTRMQGKSLVPVIQGDVDEINEYVFSEFNGTAAVVNDRYKLIQVGENLELYDLVNDPREKNNLKDEDPRTTELLEDALLQWKFDNDAAHRQFGLF